MSVTEWMGYDIWEDVEGRVSKWTCILQAFNGFGPAIAGVGWKDMYRNVRTLVIF